MSVAVDTLKGLAKSKARAQAKEYPVFHHLLSTKE